MKFFRKSTRNWPLSALLPALAGGAVDGYQAAKTTAAPIDPQRVQDQQDMTWADYHPIPGAKWADPSLTSFKKQFKVALIAVKHSDLFGNPQIDPIAREQVAQFYADLMASCSLRAGNQAWLFPAKIAKQCKENLHGSLERVASCILGGRHFMKATILDLRYRMKDVLRAIERGESVTVLHRGTVKARISPVAKPEGAKPSSDEAFGMWKDRDDLADPAEYVRSLRKPRKHDV